MHLLFSAEVTLRSRTRLRFEVDEVPETWRAGGEDSRDGLRRLDFEGWEMEADVVGEGLDGRVIGAEMVRVWELIARNGFRSRSGL